MAEGPSAPESSGAFRERMLRDAGMLPKHDRALSPESKREPAIPPVPSVPSVTLNEPYPSFMERIGRELKSIVLPSSKPRPPKVK